MDIVASRIGEYTTTTGTGNLTLSGALVNVNNIIDHRTFAASFSIGDTTKVMIYDPATGAWERTAATYSATNTLTRGTLVESSTGSRVSFASGTKLVYVVGPIVTDADLAAAASNAAAAASSASAAATSATTAQTYVGLILMGT